MENSLDHVARLAREEHDDLEASWKDVDHSRWEIHLSNYPKTWMSWLMSHHRLERSNQRRDRKPHLNSGNVLGQLYPKSTRSKGSTFHRDTRPFHLPRPTCMVTSRSSICTSLVKKSAPIVALYWLENLCETNCPIKLVLPTPLSPRERRFPSIDLFHGGNASSYPIWSLSVGPSFVRPWYALRKESNEM